MDSSSARIDALRAAFPGLPLLEREPLERHCSFRIGGPAEVFLEPRTEEELVDLLRFFQTRGERPLLLGKGTNLLFPDAGLRRPVIHIGEALAQVERRGDELLAGAGVSLAALAQRAREEGLAGLEFAHGIPGSLGGAVVMNAGAYGGELRDVVVSVRYLDGDGALRETEDLEFSYRHSRFSQRPDTVLSARLRLRPGDPAEIGARMRELAEKRQASQPLSLPSAGSAFKRPATGYAAAMIDGAGLKGFAVGGAQVSEKHAGFVVNTGGATAADVLALLKGVQDAVEAKYGVRLEPEIRIIEDEPGETTARTTE